MKNNKMKSPYKYKGYTHFDTKKKPIQIKEYVENPNNIEKHPFYPLIHYTKKYNKYNSIEKRKSKEREIYYASHIDRYIFQRYSFLVNQMYNIYMEKNHLNHVSTAYRTNCSKNNIVLANDVFQFIKKQEKSLVIVGDFTNFFDNIDHHLLKQNLLKIFETPTLQKDHYQVFKNITKYSYIEMDEIKKNLEKEKDVIFSNTKFKELDRFFDSNGFHKYKSKMIKKNQDSNNTWITYGVPQGTPISGVYANVYMIDFDDKLNKLVEANSGIYRRYSDDFILIIPENNEVSYEIFLDKVFEIVASIPNLKLQKEKTQSYICNQNVIKKLDDNSIDAIDYLGFTFDGIDVKIRDKTISKYYHKMYHAVRKNKKHKTKLSRYSLYSKYTKSGLKYGKNNFISYVYRVQKTFGKTKDTEKLLSSHKKKLNKELSKKNDSKHNNKSV